MFLKKCDPPGGWFQLGGGFHHEHELQCMDQRWQLDEMSLKHLTMRLLQCEERREFESEDEVF